MADTATIASLATAGGTLVLALATFSSTRSANRSTRIAEHSMQVGLRPVLFNARRQDPPQKVTFVDDVWLRLDKGYAAIKLDESNVYLAAPLRNVASGLAVLDAWHVSIGRADPNAVPAPASEFRRLTRDLYIPAGDIGFWQGALRDPADPQFEPLRDAVQRGDLLVLDILYGDHDGGQRTITRFGLRPVASDDDPVEGALADQRNWYFTVSRHWNLDRGDPR